MIWAPISLTSYVADSGYYPSFFTDHRYLQVSFTLLEAGYWKFNTSVLKDIEYCELVKSFWLFWQERESAEDFLSPLEWWDMGKFYLRELSRSHCKSKAMAASVTKRNLARRLNHLRRLMDAGISSVFSELCRIQEDLRAHELRAVQACQVRTRTQWVEEGEVSPSYFFSLESRRQRKKTERDRQSFFRHHPPRSS